MKRRLRQHPQQHSVTDEPQSEPYYRPRRRFPYGFIWLVLTILVLVLVIVYDRRSIEQAKTHMDTAHQLESRGLYDEALAQYEQAFENKRLGRKAKGKVALSMADIYFNNLEDYPAANRYYIQARQISPATFDPKDVQARAKRAAERSKGAAIFTPRSSTRDGVSTRTIVQRVELLQMPQSDLQGPVVATYTGGEIHAGQLLRALQKRPEFLRPDFREDPKKLEAFLDSMIRETMAYEAAVSAGIQKDLDISNRLYDYQKSLVTQRYLVDRREQAMVVDNKDVSKYYQEHLHEYVRPGQVTVSLIKADSETSAAEVLQMLRAGQRFETLATSYSVDKKTAAQGGKAGTVTEKDTILPGVGEAAQVVEALFKLPIYSVSEVTPVAGSYYIFKIDGVTPAMDITLDEARGRIENILRGRSVDHARSGLDQEFAKAFNPKPDNEGLARFWDFARQATDLRDGATTGSLQTSSTVIAAGSTTTLSNANTSPASGPTTSTTGAR